MKQHVLAWLSPLPNPSHPPKLKTFVVLIAIDPHMAIILVHVGKKLGRRRVD
jgi:hypothetical protein